MKTRGRKSRTNGNRGRGGRQPWAAIADTAKEQTARAPSETKKWDRETSLNESQTEFQAALATARDALDQFRAEPLVASKRGGPRISPWFRVWREASEVAQRWHRQLDRDKPEPSIHDEIDRLLAAESADGRVDRDT